MTWYSFIFPNTALTTATFAIAKALGDNRPIEVLGCVMTVGLICLWFFVVIMMLRAVRYHQILWPEKQEDRDEGGWNGRERQASWERGRSQRRKRFPSVPGRNGHPADVEQAVAQNMTP